MTRSSTGVGLLALVCIDDGACSEEDGGVTVSCAAADGWGCG
jgi:hypothetical protein